MPSITQKGKLDFEWDFEIYKQNAILVALSKPFGRSGGFSNDYWVCGEGSPV